MTNTYPIITNGKLLGLDLGDAWVGVAITDSAGIVARPLTTLKSNKTLLAELQTIIKTHNIVGMVIGIPVTMSGTNSQQTIKVQEQARTIQQEFPDIPCILWDERLSSKRASTLSKITPKTGPKTVVGTISIHARAAAFILDLYLQYIRQQQHLPN